jgi:hypothetical protein
MAQMVSFFRTTVKPISEGGSTRIVSRVVTVVIAAFWILLPVQGYVQPSPSVPQPPVVQIEEYHAQVPKTVIELQQFRNTTSIPIRNALGDQGSATLINLNPRINTWFVLRLQWGQNGVVDTYHLENPEPTRQAILLDPGYPEGLVIVSGEERYRCELWSEPSHSNLFEARASHSTYAPLCDDRLFLRNKTQGHKTTVEWVTDFLRRHVAYGEKITVFVREHFFKDAYLSISELISGQKLGAGTRPRPPGAPARPLTNPRYDNTFLNPADLGISLENGVTDKILIGRWYRAKDLPGIYVSVIQPNLVSEEVIESQRNQVNPLDTVESTALVYIVAFDLDRFDLGFEMGTEHPGVGWSDRVPEQVRDSSLPGPDGIDTVEPLLMTGMVSPAYWDRIAATFVGGFKRYHGAFRYSDLAFKNHGSHYGFIEDGVVLSKLQPGLATVVVFDDGAVEIKTWTEKDNADLWKIRHARQNGVPIIEYDATTGTSKTGALVPRWGQGNWSGSADKRFRTVRAGLGFQEHEGQRFLIYAYFSAATPSAMARIFRAYCCKYAMLLDINALEHTYSAVYRLHDSEFSVEHLIKGMGVLDKSIGGKVAPRFIGYADNRDFFYLLRKANR